MGEKSRAFLEKKMIPPKGDFSKRQKLKSFCLESFSLRDHPLWGFLREKSRAFLEKKSRAFLYKMGEKSRAFLICLSFILFSIPRGDDFFFQVFSFKAFSFSKRKAPLFFTKSSPEEIPKKTFFGIFLRSRTK
jgi:hypothetical protein